MKTTLPIFILILISTLCLAQNRSAKATFEYNELIIDKSENNKALFDYSDPFSLVSLIKFNMMPGVLSGASEKDKKKLGDYPLYEFQINYEESRYPLMSAPDKDGNTWDSLDVNGNPVYPAPEYINYGVDKISRITAVKGEVTNEVTGETYYGVKSLKFATKANNEFIPVLELNYADLIKMDGFKVIKELSKETLSKLKGKPLTLIYEYNNGLYEENKNAKKDNLLPNDLPFFAYHGGPKKDFIFYRYTSVREWKATDHAWRNTPWDETITWESLSEEEKEKLDANSIKIPSMYPLQTNPDAFGVVYDSIDDKGNPVYPSPTNILYSLKTDFNKAYAIYDFRYYPFNGNMKLRTVGLEQVVFTFDYNGKEAVGLEANLYRLMTKKETAGIAYGLTMETKNDFSESFINDYSKTPWITTLQKELNKSKSDSEEKGDVRKKEAKF